MTNKTLSAKFDSHKEEILNNSDNFDFMLVVKMMRAVNFGWTKTMPEASLEELAEYLRKIAATLLNDTIKYCLDDNDEYFVATAGLKATARPDGFLQLEFVPMYWYCGGDSDDDEPGA